LSITDRPEPGDPRWRITPTKIVVAVILLIAIVVPLLVSTYDQAEPKLWGFPFFYWYQLVWVFIAAGLCALSYLLLKRERDAYRRDHPTARTEDRRP
jgi:Na+/melibiose symporter-like transporter